MANLQQQDPQIRDIILQLRGTHAPQNMLKDNVLHFLERAVDNPRIFVPQQVRQSYLDFYHGHSLSGHLDFHKIWSKIMHLYYWPAMRHDVSAFLQQCPTY